MSSSPPSISLGITVMPEWFQCEGIESVLDNLQAAGATALVTSPYLMRIVDAGQGAREPPPDGEAGAVRPLDRELWGQRETWVSTAPALVHQPSRYQGLRYQPSPAGDLTAAHPDFLDRVIEQARARGMQVDRVTSVTLNRAKEAALVYHSAAPSDVAALRADLYLVVQVRGGAKTISRSNTSVSTEGARGL
jgi:hypothetical protein